MKDAYKKAFLSKTAANYEKEGVDGKHALHLAIAEWKEAVEDNEYLGNTTTFYGDATDFIKHLSNKFAMMEVVISSKLGREPDLNVIDRIAKSF
jgi:hypothetical protein